MRPSLRRAFTLIELLTVIAIIAILAAILFPVFAKAREKAQTASCTSNIKQLATAMKMYTMDYDSRYPSPGNGFNNAFHPSDWIGITANSTVGAQAVELGSLFPYVKNAQAYICPNAVYAAEPNTVGGVNYTRTSYTMNGKLSTGIVAGQPNSSWIGLRETRVQFPAQTFLLVEEQDQDQSFQHGGYNDGVFYIEYANNWSDQPCGRDDAHSRHANGSLTSFVDGHAKWLAYSDCTPFDHAFNSSGTAGKHLAWYYPQRPGADQLPTSPD